MRYFMYSPLDMSEHQAHEIYLEAEYEGWLGENEILNIHSDGLEFVPIIGRPLAKPGTYLVRVEPDGSLRTVQKALV